MNEIKLLAQLSTLLDVKNNNTLCFHHMPCKNKISQRFLRKENHFSLVDKAPGWETVSYSSALGMKGGWITLHQSPGDGDF